MARSHPERDLIVRRYLKKQARLYFPALAQLDETAPPIEEPDEPGREEQLEERVSLRDQRLGTVQSVLKASGARRVLDLDGPAETEAALSRVRAAVDAAGLWEALGTGWLVLDCELLPWSAKAVELIRRQYASVGAAANAGLNATTAALDLAGARGLDVAPLLDRQRHRLEHIGHYVDAYRRYVWPVNGVSDLRLAPFHVLAAETGVFIDRDHTWHLKQCDQLVTADPDWFQATGRRAVDVTDAGDQAAGAAWWEELTASGGEGMVVKPMSFIARGRKGLVQPGIRCRGREYLLSIARTPNTHSCTR